MATDPLFEALSSFVFMSLSDSDTYHGCTPRLNSTALNFLYISSDLFHSLNLTDDVMSLTIPAFMASSITESILSLNSGASRWQCESISFRTENP